MVISNDGLMVIWWKFNGGEMGFIGDLMQIHCGNLLHNSGKDPPCSMEKSTISMAVFHSYFEITRTYELCRLESNQC